VWPVEKGGRANFRDFGIALHEANPNLYWSEGGLVVARPGEKAKAIKTARQFAALIADTMGVAVVKGEKVVSDMIFQGHLNAMLDSQTFLSNFRKVKMLSTLPIYHDDFTLAEPGQLRDGILYLGPPPAIGQGTRLIDTFLDVLPFATLADRTNAVAAAITVMLRHFWPGAKPVVLVMGTKSHCGKGTVTFFFCGQTLVVAPLYEGQDWPVQKQLQLQLQMTPEAGVILFDNVRLDSSGRAGFIRSAIMESLITSPEIKLAAPGAGSGMICPNHFVTTFNSNHGTFCPDLLNRGLPIHLAPQGDWPPTDCPIGSPKDEFLPAHRAELEAEVRGLIERWREAGRPLDQDVRHPMIQWARTVGGILTLGGYREFLDNYQASRKVSDPEKDALTLLAAAVSGQALRPGEWAALAVEWGLVKTLIGPNERDTEKGRERAMGVVLSRHLNETFEVKTDAQNYRVKLEGGYKVWKPGEEQQKRYVFTFLDNSAATMQP
jgi:hypothetical protein